MLNKCAEKADLWSQTLNPTKTNVIQCDSEQESATTLASLLFCWYCLVSCRPQEHFLLIVPVYSLFSRQVPARSPGSTHTHTEPSISAAAAPS